jgi:hypothetical protein
MTGRPWTLPNMLRMLRNPFYAGLMRYGYHTTTEAGIKLNPDGPQLAQGPQPTYLTLSDWERVQRTIGGASRPHRAAHEGRALLAGNLRCSLCGGPAITHSMTTGDAETGRYSYTCRSHNVGGQCPGWHRRGRHIELAVLSVIDQTLQTLPADPPPEVPSTDVAKLRRELDKLSTKLQRQMDAYDSGDYSLETYRQRRAETEARRLEIAGQLARAEAVRTPPAAVWAQLRDWGDRWNSAASVAERRKLLDEVLGQPVETDGRTVTVTLRDLPHPNWTKRAVIQLPPPGTRL